MNIFEETVIDLVRMADTPLYTAYHALCRDIGGSVEMPQFLDMINQLMANDIVQVWLVEPGSGVVKSFNVLPEGLPSVYEAQAPSDGSYDPLGLTVSLGAAAPPVDEPLEWTADIDFVAQRFSVEADTAEREPQVLDMLHRFFPGRDFRIEIREVNQDRIQSKGFIS